MSLAGGEVVAGGVGVEVVGLSVEGHGDGGFRCAVGEEEGVFVGDCDGGGVVGGGGGWRREFAEGEEVRGVAGVEDAEARVLLDLDQDLQEGLFAQEKEP